MQSVRTSGRNTVAVVITTLSYSHLHCLAAADAFNKLQTLSPLSLSSLFSFTDCPGERKELASSECSVQWIHDHKRQQLLLLLTLPGQTYRSWFCWWHKLPLMELPLIHLAGHWLLVLVLVLVLVLLLLLPLFLLAFLFFFSLRSVLDVLRYWLLSLSIYRARAASADVAWDDRGAQFFSSDSLVVLFLHFSLFQKMLWEVAKSLLAVDWYLCVSHCLLFLWCFMHPSDAVIHPFSIPFSFFRFFLFSFLLLLFFLPFSLCPFITLSLVCFITQHNCFCSFHSQRG